MHRPPSPRQTSRTPAAGADAPGVLGGPDPEGPREASGVDGWAQHTREVLEPFGHLVELVDVFESYHLLFGEAHCGTNVQRAPPAVRWWERPAVNNRGRE